MRAKNEVGWDNYRAPEYAVRPQVSTKVSERLRDVEILREAAESLLFSEAV